MDISKAAKYVEARLRDGSLTSEDIAWLTHAFQEKNVDLEADGMPGPSTIRVLRETSPGAMRCYPLPQLSDGRRPQITSGFGPRGGRHHDGCDLFYRWQESDGPVRMGDGGATRGPDGKPKWFIPDGTPAIAAAAGFVQDGANKPQLTRTGWRIWIQHSYNKRTGYFHLRNAKVKAGDRVEMGQLLGEIGDNPIDVDAEHLHFEVSTLLYRPEDPEKWLQGARYVAL